jgi:four helix bundle protein
MEALQPDFIANDWLASISGGGVEEPAKPYGAAGHRRNAVVEETFELASRVMDYCERLIGVNRVFADQVLRSGTSVGSHVREAQSAESLSDFLHKMKIAHKELEETDYRLALCHVKAHYPHDADLVKRVKALVPLFHRILTTTRSRLNEQLAVRRSRRNP